MPAAAATASCGCTAAASVAATGPSVRTGCAELCPATAGAAGSAELMALGRMLPVLHPVSAHIGTCVTSLNSVRGKHVCTGLVIGLSAPAKSSAQAGRLLSGFVHHALKAGLVRCHAKPRFCARTWNKYEMLLSDLENEQLLIIDAQVSCMVAADCTHAERIPRATMPALRHAPAIGTSGKM